MNSDDHSVLSELPQVIVSDAGNIDASIEHLKKIRSITRENHDVIQFVEAAFKLMIQTEKIYAQNLCEVSARLTIAAQRGCHAMRDIWEAVASAVEFEAMIHRNHALEIQSRICQPLEKISEQYHEKKPVVNQTYQLLKTLSTIHQEAQEAKMVTNRIIDEFTALKSDPVVEHGISSQTNNKLLEVEKFIQIFSKKHFDVLMKSERVRHEAASKLKKESIDAELLEKRRVSELKSFVVAFKDMMLNKETSHIEQLNSMKIEELSNASHNCCALHEVGAPPILSVVSQRLAEFFSQLTELPLSRNRREQLMLELQKAVEINLKEEKGKKMDHENFLKLTEDNVTEKEGKIKRESIMMKLVISNSLIRFLDECRLKLSETLSNNFESSSQTTSVQRELLSEKAWDEPTLVPETTYQKHLLDLNARHQIQQSDRPFAKENSPTFESNKSQLSWAPFIDEKKNHELQTNGLSLSSSNPVIFLTTADNELTQYSKDEQGDSVRECQDTDHEDILENDFESSSSPFSLAHLFKSQSTTGRLRPSVPSQSDVENWEESNLDSLVSDKKSSCDNTNLVYPKIASEVDHRVGMNCCDHVHTFGGGFLETSAYHDPFVVYGWEQGDQHVFRSGGINSHTFASY